MPVLQSSPHWHAGNAQLLPQTKIGLHESPHVIIPPREGHHARSAARSALEAVANHAGTAAHAALFQRPAAGAIERGKHMFIAQLKAVDVVEIAVVGFAGHWQRPLFEIAAARHQPFDGGVPGEPAGMRIGDANGALAAPALLHPVAAAEFAIAVEAEIAGKNRRPRAIATARQDGGDAGADGALADHSRPVAGNERAVAHFNARHVGDGVELAGPPGERNAKGSGAEFAGRRFKHR